VAWRGLPACWCARTSLLLSFVAAVDILGHLCLLNGSKKSRVNKEQAWNLCGGSFSRRQC
jgi:hypothetical protein